MAYSYDEWLTSGRDDTKQYYGFWGSVIMRSLIVLRNNQRPTSVIWVCMKFSPIPRLRSMFNKKHVIDSIQFTPVADSKNEDIRILAILSGAMAVLAWILLG